MADNDFVKVSQIASGKGTTVGGSLTVTFQAGCVIARTDTGTITITLDAAVGFVTAAMHILRFRLNTTAVVQALETNTSDSVKTIVMGTTGGTATEAAFEFEIVRLLTRAS